MKTHRLFDHTADVGIDAEATTAAELFEALAEGLAEVICPPGTVEAERAVHVEVAAEDREGLVVDFLNRVLHIIETERFLVAKVSVSRADDRAVSADVYGQTYDPARHDWAREVKAVTYHQLKVAREGDTWRGRVILDL